MSEFEKELLDKVSPHDRTANGHELFIGGVLLEHFKDWQPHKELVKIPQFVADWFKNQLKNNESKKFDGNDVFRIIQDVIKVSNNENTWGDFDITDEICEFAENNEELFLNLIVNCSLDYGYTVEKEQLYEVVFYVDDEDDRCLLMKTGKTILFEFETQNEGHYKQQFTEQEIKAIDKRYWEFAVKVDEVNP